jgi:hypothetical protein
MPKHIEVICLAAAFMWKNRLQWFSETFEPEAR